MSNPTDSTGLVHLLATIDTGEAYTQFHGWILDCLWCDHSTRGKTKGEALEKMQKHYDSLDGIGDMTLR